MPRRRLCRGCLLDLSQRGHTTWARFAYFHCGKGSRLGFVESIGTKRIEQRGPQWEETQQSTPETDWSNWCLCPENGTVRGQRWGSMWTLTQESYHDEAETVCHNCYVGKLAPQTQKDALHTVLTGVVRHWIGKDYTVDRTKGRNPTDIDGFAHSQQPLTDAVMRKCSMKTTKLRSSEHYTSIYMSLNIKRHVYVSYTTYNLLKRIKRHSIFLTGHIIFPEI